MLALSNLVLSITCLALSAVIISQLTPEQKQSIFDKFKTDSSKGERP
jgi:hypothetical protein